MPAPQKRQRQKQGRQARQQAALAARRRSSRRNTVIATIVVMAVVIGLIAALSGGGGGKSTKASSTNTTAQLKPVAKGASITGDTPCPKPDGTSTRTTSFAKPPPMCIDPAKGYTARIVTTKGTIT